MKRIQLIFVLMFLSMVTCLAQTYDSVFVYSKGKAIHALLRFEIDSITYSSNTVDGKETDRIATQILSTFDHNYLDALSEVDSIVFKEVTINWTVAEEVDLGLSVKWASHNIGATAPEEYGRLIGWGDTTGKKISTDWNDYPSPMPPENICGTEYDIAHVKWGGKWRLPSKNEFKELAEKCESEFTKYNGVYGMKFTGPNGNSIFLPAAGFRYYTTLYGVGKNGYYVSGTIGDSILNSCSLYFSSQRLDWSDYGNRFDGLSVRPVADK